MIRFLLLCVICTTMWPSGTKGLPASAANKDKMTPTQILAELKAIAAANPNVKTVYLKDGEEEDLKHEPRYGQITGTWGINTKKCADRVSRKGYGCPIGPKPGQDFNRRYDVLVYGRCYWTGGAPACLLTRCGSGELEIAVDDRGDGYGCVSGEKEFCCPI